MNNDEARFLLNAYRPAGRDADDPAMREALDHAQRDPVVKSWFERQRAHDAAVAAKLREIAPPPGLREAILAGARASVRAPEPRVRWRRPVWWSLMAAAIVVFGLAAWWRFAPVEGATFEDFAVNFVERGFLLEARGADVGALRTWLAARQAPLPVALPAEFARLRALGCRTLEYRSRGVSLICFERGGKEYHVFVARREDVPGAGPAADRPNYFSRGGHVAASWADASHRYVVVSDADMESLRRIL